MFPQNVSLIGFSVSEKSETKKLTDRHTIALVNEMTRPGNFTILLKQRVYQNYELPSHLLTLLIEIFSDHACPFPCYMGAWSKKLRD